MLVQTGRHFTTVVLGVLITSMAGCGQSGFESYFVFSDRTESLMPEAQNGVDDLPGVRDLVEDRFGTPQNLNAWKKLPIEFGGVFGTISESPDTSVAVKELSLTLDEPFEVNPEEPIELQFMTGEAAPRVVRVEKWSAENGMASLTAAMEKAPASGDMVVVNGGGVLKHGRGLYMRHCSHCHGTSGDGNGPTASYLYPRPRDYRHGVFKFTGTDATAKVSRDDLTRVLRNGIAGTYMPSFVPMLNEEELTAVVEYVRFLSMRGEFERKIVNELAADYSRDALESRVEGGETKAEIVDELKAFLAEDLPDSLEFVSDDLSRAWTEADSDDVQIIPTVARVPNSEESRRRGRELYLSKGINCADCHGIDGKGNGPQTTIFEKKPGTTELYPEPGLHDIWDNINQPRNLTLGIYRGGRRPIDLFRRIHAGIKGSRMPSYAKNLKHEQIWDIVNYVLSIPFDSEPGRGPAADTTAATASL